MTRSKPGLAPETTEKVEYALLTYAYKQLYSSLIAAFSGATVTVIVLYYHGYKAGLFPWYGLFLTVALIRATMIKMYFHQKNREEHMNLWRNLYIFGAALGGLCWGLASLFFYSVSEVEQIFIILALVTATAWSLTTLSAILEAAIIFILTALLPFVARMISFDQTDYLLLTLIFSIFILFLLVHSVKTHLLIKKTMMLQFKKDFLLGDVTTSKRE
jgi:hypothetical protein